MITHYDGIKMHGHYIVQTEDEAGNINTVGEYDNLITMGMYNIIFKFLNQPISQPDVSDMNINYIATGTGTSSPTHNDTKLSVEIFRKAPSSKIIGTNNFTCKLILAPSESNGTITELGVFCNGTSTADSGTLISHALCNIVKNANLKYLITWILTIE